MFLNGDCGTLAQDARMRNDWPSRAARQGLQCARTASGTARGHTGHHVRHGWTVPGNPMFNLPTTRPRPQNQPATLPWRNKTLERSGS